MSFVTAARARSFWLLILAELVFMAGYISLKISLALYLKLAGYSSLSAYAIAASSLSLFALATLSWGYLSHFLPDKKRLLLLGVVLVGLGYVFVLQDRIGWVELGVACFVSGGALTSLNLKLLVNEHFERLADRQQGNSVLQWTMNLGSFFGVLGLSMTPLTLSLNSVYKLSFIELVLCFLVYLIGQPFIFSKPIEKRGFNAWLKFITALTAMLLLVVALVYFSNLTRFLIVLLFLIVTIKLLHLAKQQSNQGYFAYLIMLLIGGGGYWLAVAIFQTSFPVFLHQDVADQLFGWHVSSLVPLLIDPVANMLIGAGLLWLYKRRVPSAYRLLIASMLCNLLAFTILSLSDWLSGAHQVALVWPMLSVFFYAGSEFLLITTLVTQVAHLIDYKWRGFFLGYNRIAGAFYVVLIFYFIQWTKKSGSGLIASKQSNAHLFLLMWFVLVIFLIAFVAMRRLVKQEEI